MKCIDLFCGCGGLSLGFLNAGIEIKAGFDNWDSALNIYKNNFEHEVVKMDLSEMNEFSVFKNYNIDMIIGGPPCQDFSSAGKRDETLGRADLTLKFAEIIQNVKPKYFLMENVERIKNSSILEKAKEIYIKEGYGLTEKVLNASYCGVPQSRKRFFLFGELYGKDNALNFYLEKNLSNKQMTIYDYLGDSLGLEYYYRHPRSYARRGIFSIYEPSPTVRGVNRPVPPNYKKHAGDLVDIDEKIRPLSTIERSYLQTFPKSFVFEGTKTDLEQMIGNAVPVKLAEYVAKCILEYFDSKKKNGEKKFENIKNNEETIKKRLFAI